MGDWTVADMPSQAGRTALVTGANSGLGYAIALELARRGAQVIMAARDAGRGNAAVARLKAELPGAKVELGMLDLGDLDSVTAFTSGLVASGRPIDLLINNAGVMATARGKTSQGFETQFGVNHLGHFALTMAVLPLMSERPDPRVVTVTSGLHKSGTINFDDLQSEASYNPMKAYSQSKLANVLFALELDRRLRAEGSRVKSLLAHPGIATSNLTSSMGAGMVKTVSSLLIPLLAQSVPAGATPVLRAATEPNVSGGEFYGPRGLGELRGSPVIVQPTPRAKDAAMGLRLWQISERLTLPPAAALA
jgi:NAD(P)-dependent dehydrogenase (short-subunit alcohol dehydrogenase family)